MDTHGARRVADQITGLASRVDNLRRNLASADKAKAHSKDGRADFYNQNIGLEIRISLGFVRAQIETDLKDAERALAALIGRLERRD